MRHLKPRMATRSEFKTKSDNTCLRPQVTDIKTEVLPSVLKLQKHEKISRLYEH